MSIPTLHLVMHGVAIKKHAAAAEIASVAALPVAVVSAELGAACANGRIANANEKYLLTPAGQMILTSEYSRFYGELRIEEKFLWAYSRFEQINKELKQLITDWQTIEVGGARVSNTHADHAYDDRLIARLGDLHERAEPLLAPMIASVPRLSTYKIKLTHALERAEDREIAWVSDAKLESYHTVWFELHEDLLRLLGKQREE